MSAQPTPRWGRAGFHQRGQAMIFTVLLIVVGVTGVVYTLLTPSKISIENDKKTAAALVQARDALIGRAASDSSIPGSLPCPDTDDDGVADLFSGSNCPSYTGRLPWKTLELPDLRDASGERLWYALSPNFRDHPAVQPLNSDTAGQLAITGTVPASSIIAIVLSPGPVVGSQIRGTGNQNIVANYLEGGNDDGDTTFVTGAASTTFNDRLLPITSDTLFSVVNMRVAREARAFLTAYFNTNGYYPFANDYADPTFNCTLLLYRGRISNPGGGLPLSACGLIDWLAPAAPPAWFVPNNWHYVVFYAVAPACTSPLSAGACLNVGGFLTVNGMLAPNDDKRAIVIVTGRGLAGQTRPCSSVSDCLEDPENTNGDNTYVNNLVTATVNDRLVVVAP